MVQHFQGEIAKKLIQSTELYTGSVGKPWRLLVNRDCSICWSSAFWGSKICCQKGMGRRKVSLQINFANQLVKERQGWRHCQLQKGEDMHQPN